MPSVPATGGRRLRSPRCDPSLSQCRAIGPSAGASGPPGLTELGEKWWTDPAGRFAWNMSARSVALSESWDDDNDARPRRDDRYEPGPERGLSLVGVQALGEALAGRPVDALRVAAGIRHAAASMSILRSELAIAEAVAHREMGDRALRLDELARDRRRADRHPDVLHRQRRCWGSRWRRPTMATRSCVRESSPVPRHSSRRARRS